MPSATLSRARPWLARLLTTFVTGCVAAIAFPAAAQDKTPPRPEQIAFDVRKALQPALGDLDKMIERRTIRVLTSYNRSNYFLDKGVQRGITHDVFRLFEEELNQRLAQEQKKKHVKVRVLFIPVARDQMLQALASGKGDIAAANLTVTPERQKLVDFSAPVYPEVSEVLVTGPASPKVASVEDLSGKEVFVRKSSSYHESLLALNRELAARKKPAVAIKAAPEALNDEDLIEMVAAGLIPLTIIDRHIADFWQAGVSPHGGARGHRRAQGRRNRLGHAQEQPQAQGRAR